MQNIWIKDSFVIPIPSVPLAFPPEFYYIIFIWQSKMETYFFLGFVSPESRLSSSSWFVMSAMVDTRSFKKSNWFSDSIHCFLKETRQCIWHDKWRLSQQAFDFYQSYVSRGSSSLITGQWMKAVSDTVPDMINAVYQAE